MATIFRDSSDVVFFAEAAVTSPLFMQQSDTIVFIEVNRANRGSSVSNDFLDLYDSNRRNFTTSRGTNDALNFTDRAVRGVKVRQTNDALIFVENSRVVLNYRFTKDVLSLNENNTNGQSILLSDSLVFVDSNSHKINRTWLTNDVIVFVEGNGAYKPDAWNPVYTISNVTTADPIIFKYNTTELSYRHYEFGNIESDEFTRVNRFTRGGFLIIGPTKARIQTLDISFSLCGQLQCDTLLKFFKTTLGKEIEFRDHESVWWDGIVLTPEAPRTQIGRNTFTMTVKFEGVRR